MSSAATDVGLLLTKATVGCGHLQQAEAVRITHPILQTRTLVTGSGRRASGSAPCRRTTRPRRSPIAHVSGPGGASWSLARGVRPQPGAGRGAGGRPAGGELGWCLPSRWSVQHRSQAAARKSRPPPSLCGSSQVPLLLADNKEGAWMETRVLPAPGNAVGHAGV